MRIQIGNNNNFQGNINIGDNAMQIAKDFYQEFNNVEKILELLKEDIIKGYKENDKEEILKVYEDFRTEMAKSPDKRNNSFIKSKLSVLNKAFSLIADSSSIASLLFTMYQVFSNI